MSTEPKQTKDTIKISCENVNIFIPYEGKAGVYICSINKCDHKLDLKCYLVGLLMNKYNVNFRLNHILCVRLCFLSRVMYI